VVPRIMPASPTNASWPRMGYFGPARPSISAERRASFWIDLQPPPLGSVLRMICRLRSIALQPRIINCFYRFLHCAVERSSMHLTWSSNKQSVRLRKYQKAKGGRLR
jgi:hypothetical protein